MFSLISTAEFQPKKNDNLTREQYLSIVCARIKNLDTAQWIYICCIPICFIRQIGVVYAQAVCFFYSFNWEWIYMIVTITFDIQNWDFLNIFKNTKRSYTN